MQIYNFDRQLRTILFGAIEVLEIFLRARFSYFHAHKYGALGYLDKRNYKPQHNHADFHKLITAEIYQNRKVPFVKHHQEKYKGQFPIWASIIALKALYPYKNQWNLVIASPIIDLIEKNKNVINLHHIGFPTTTWKKELLKN